MPNNNQRLVVSANNLSAGYGGVPLWTDASFTVGQGQFVGLLGANGAGKSTLFNLILGMNSPLKGELNVFGSSPKIGNSRIGYMPQRHNVDQNSQLNSIEYVRLGLNGNKYGFSLPKHTVNELNKSVDTLSKVSAEHLAYRPLHELSGGEQQRIYFAQALVCQPELLLLDEPFASLDINHAAELIKLVSEVAKQNKLAVIIITHDINPLLNYIDNIIYIANGKVANGKPDEIINSETLSAMYNAPVEVLKDSKGRLAVLGIESAPHHE